MGGAQAIFALAYGTETIAAGRRGRRARATPGCGRRSAASTDGRDRLPGGALRADGRRRRTTPIPSGRRSTSAPRPSTGPTGRWSPSPPRRRRSTRLAAATERAAARAPRRRRRAAGPRPRPRPERRHRPRQRLRPRAPRAALERGRGALAERVTDGGLRLRRPPQRAPPSATTSPAPTTCCRPAAPGRFSGPLGPGTFRRKIATVEVPAGAGGEACPARRDARPGGGLPRARRVGDD